MEGPSESCMILTYVVGHLGERGGSARIATLAAIRSLILL